MNFEILNFNENKEHRKYAAITPIPDFQTSSETHSHTSNGDEASDASEPLPHVLNNVKVLNDNFITKDLYSCDMTTREKINWLEQKIIGLKNTVEGNEIWMLSKDGHAMKVKCLLTTNELPECKGIGMPSTIKFLRQMKKSLISAGVTEKDWVTLASSRLRGKLRAVWESKSSPNLSWSEFSDFLVTQVHKKRKIKSDDRRVKKKKLFYEEDYLLKNKPDMC